ncbi:Integrator complex subunit 3 [Nymphon striatum]|nr:Integrator complex subunit 3 [Nymphon striatum]
MELNKSTPPKLVLYVHNPIEAKDEHDEKYEHCFGLVKTICNGASENEFHDLLNVMVCKGAQQYEEVSIGLIMMLLTDTASSARSYRDLTLITRDSLGLAINVTNHIILEKFLRLNDTARQQMVWFVKEMVKNSVISVHTSVQNLMKQIAGGDISSRNVWLAEAVLDILSTNRPWLDKFPALIPVVIFTYVRLIVDHNGPQYLPLRQREVVFCVSVLRDKFHECMAIGRDLVRILQNVARIPEFEKLWQDISNNPSSLHQTFTGSYYCCLFQLLSILSLTCVKFGLHKRYQDWFQRQYLSMPESHSLRCDLIRYICCVIHPSNEVLCSDIIPRWAIIGWLLTTCTSPIAAANAKLSLFYDWLCYDAEKDNIMNIEPAILVMHHSMRVHPVITATLLDFLCRIIPNFNPSAPGIVKKGVSNSLRQILDKRVLPTLSPLFNNSKLDKELRLMIRETFTEFCHLEVKEESNAYKEMPELTDTSHHIMNNGSDEAQFSEDEDDIPLGIVLARKLKMKENKFKPEDQSKGEELELQQNIDLLSKNIKKAIVAMKDEPSNEIQCEIMEKLLLAILQEENFDQDTASTIGHCLNHILRNQFIDKVFPDTVDDESIEDSIGAPLFVLFRNLCHTPEDDPSRQPLLLILSEMSIKQSKIGFLLLYFHKASNLNRNKMSAYRDYCKMNDSRCDLSTCLLNDLMLCQEECVRMFCYLIPDTYSQFANSAVGKPDLLNLIVSCIDSTQLQELVCQILQGNMIMFRKESFLAILNASLEWETFEQYCVWQLIAAHNIPVEHILPVLPKVEYTGNAEAITNILLMLKQEKPTDQLLKHLFSREPKRNDFLVASVLKYWSQEHEDKLAELISNALGKHFPTPAKRKSKASSKLISPTLEQTLAHLDQLRVVSKQTNFFSNDSMQAALSQVQSSGSESLKTKFGDILALVDDVEDVKVPRGSRGRKGGKNSAKTKNNTVPDSDSSNSSSEDEEKVKPKPKKRKKMAVICDSD